jgi:hypothetical protein
LTNERSEGGEMKLGDLFVRFPVALLTREDE